MIFLLFLKLRSEGGTSAVVLSLLVHTERVPRGRTEDLVLGYVVHADRNAEHRAERDKVCAYVTVGDRSVVSAPVVHNVIRRLECALAGATGSEPGARPGVVGASPKRVADVVGQGNSPDLRDLQFFAILPKTAKVAGFL